MDQLALSLDDEWRPVPDWPMYRVNRSGRVQSHYWRRQLTDAWFDIVGGVGKRGYRRIRLHDGEGNSVRMRVHVLVLTVFVGPCPPGLEGCHNDGNPRNRQTKPCSPSPPPPVGRGRGGRLDR